MDKKALRRDISAKKRAMSPDEIAHASQRLAEQFFQTELYRNAQSIYGYLSYNQEVRTEAILRRAMADGKRVAVPKVFGDDMKFLWIDDLSLVAPGYFDIPEPIADGPEADDDLALVLMPGLAFDAVRAGVTALQAAEFYGMTFGRNRRARCPTRATAR